MEKKLSIVAGAMVALILYTLALAASGPAVSLVLTNGKTVSSSGSVKGVGVGVYWDQSCTNEVTSINWGALDPSSNVNKTIFIRNEGNTAATLSIATSNWNPTNASSFITLNWNYNGETVNVNQIIQVGLVLSVSSNVAGITNFSFDITIVAVG